MTAWRAMEIIPLGDSALMVRVGDSLEAVLATTHQLEAAKISSVVDIAPAFASVALFFERPQDYEETAAQLREILGPKRRAGKSRSKVRTIEIPVCYDPEFGLDLGDVARHCGLSPNEIVTRHAGGDYRVRCLGFTPGFPFMGGLPGELATPRRATPRTVVPAGSVGIGGVQTGVYPLPSPGGWNIIGRTPLRLFDASRDPAALLQAGDTVRFRAITREEFEQWAK
jgi:inhibitor of KinA